MEEANVHVIYKDEQGTAHTEKLEGVCREVDDINALREGVLEKPSERKIEHKVRERSQ
jgi:hypothetical protein